MGTFPTVKYITATFISTDGDVNGNKELLQGWGASSQDTAKETIITDAPLKEIIFSDGHDACMNSIAITCGSQVLGGQSKTIVITMNYLIRFRGGLPYYQSENEYEPACMYFNLNGIETLSARSEIFKCNDNDEKCLYDNIYVNGRALHTRVR